MWTGFPSPFIQLVFLFGNGVFGTFPDFPVLWGSEIKPFSITHLSQEIGKGSEELEAVVVFLLSSWSWVQWGSLSVWGFQAGIWHCHVHLCPSSLHLIPWQQSTKLLCPLGPLALRWLHKAASPVTGLDLILVFV